jgi:hypothetical protein
MSQRSSRRSLMIAILSLFSVFCGILVAIVLYRDNSAYSRVNSTVFGIADPGLIGEPVALQGAQLEAMRSVGITSVRVDANWSTVQPYGPTTFRWAGLDQVVESIRAVGMSVDLIIDGCPPWAAVPSAARQPFSQPASSALYATWAADVANRYSREGVTYFEIWNEPNIAQFWRPKPNPAAYTADLIAAYAAIKRVDPHAFVISGGLAAATSSATNYSPVSFLQQMYLHGARGSFDGLGDHPYSYPDPPDSYDHWSAWSQMARTVPSIRSVMIENGDGSKQVWITEFGAPSIGPAAVGAMAQRTEISQALGYVKKMSWIAAFYIYTWQDSVNIAPRDNGFGLLSVSGRAKPAFSAVANALAH